MKSYSGASLDCLISELQCIKEKHQLEDAKTMVVFNTFNQDDIPWTDSFKLEVISIYKANTNKYEHTEEFLNLCKWFPQIMEWYGDTPSELQYLIIIEPQF